MSKLQEAVDKFAADWREKHAGAKPSQDLLMDGTFSRFVDQEFCLCFVNFTGVASMINFAGFGCRLCGKRITDETYAWADEARRERKRLAQ